MGLAQHILSSTSVGRVCHQLSHGKVIHISVGACTGVTALDLVLLSAGQSFCDISITEYPEV